MSSGNNSVAASTASSRRSSSLTKKRNKTNGVVWFWASECKYDVIINRVKQMGWKAIEDEKKEEKCNIFWVDVALIHERLRMAQPWQIVNHFPGMPNIARKNRMGQNLNKFQKIFPKEYSFYPRTWVLPGELNDFRAQFDNQGNSLGNKIFIIKPDTGCQGRGIFLTKTFDPVPHTENVVAQVYMKKPLLIDNFKFDLRIYVLVTCVKPLRMYMFQDGLVRMCTEEYVKPTKQNLGMACMHLTNYAVNKTNANFQQPDAKATNECQDDSSKRSLVWFMNWIRKDFGDEKADKLWKRIGIITVRTLLTIIPTLSREYDQHFKAFNNVPLNPQKKAAEGTTAGGDTADGSAPEATGSASTTPPPSSVPGSAGGEAATAEGAEEEDGGNSGGNPSGGADDDGGIGGFPGSCGVRLDANLGHRGSRCFEVLGLDIMIDSNLNPWMIEVNHLPSFGTDSPLDLDIKSRLMEEVFNVLPVLPDDEMAFELYHKAEAERRLTIDRTMASLGKTRDKLTIEKEKEAEREKERQERINRRKAKEAAAAAALKQQAEADAAALRDAEQPHVVQINRIDQIKGYLVDIYNDKCPDKVSKIDRLLERYGGREEEFLLFVCDKYNVPVPQEPIPVPVPQMNPTPQPTTATGKEEDEVRGRRRDVDSPMLRSESEGPDRAADDSSAHKLDHRSMSSMEGKAKKDAQAAAAGVPRFGSRSLSPPGPNRRAASNWKGGDDEELYKLEVAQQHIPEETDPWLVREMKILKSFTRIFPPLPVEKKQSEDDGTSKTTPAIDTGATIKAAPSTGSSEGGATGAAAEEDGGGGEEEAVEEEDEGDEDDGEEGAKDDKDKAKDSKGVKKVKVASFQDILIEAFLQDRRQTLRLRGPLPRNKDEGPNSSLPALENKGKALKMNLQTKGGGFGKPPPKPETKKPERPNISQAEAANRLYQGLSTMSTAAATNSASQGMMGYPGPFPPGTNNSSFTLDTAGGSITVPTVYQGQPVLEAPNSLFAYGGMDAAAFQPQPMGGPVSESNGYYVTSIDSSGVMAPQRYIQPFRQPAARGVLMAQQNPKPTGSWPNQQSYVLEQSYFGAPYATAAGVKLNNAGMGAAIVPSGGPPQQPAKYKSPAPASILKQQLFKFDEPSQGPGGSGGNAGSAAAGQIPRLAVQAVPIGLPPQNTHGIMRASRL